VPADQPVEIQLLTEPWLTRPTQVEWFALVPKYTRCNVTNLSSSQVGFVADAAPRPVWEEIRLPHSALTLPIAKIEHYFEPRLHCGSLRLRARANLNGRMRQTPVIEVRRFVNHGFRAALSEQFGLPYLFGSAELSLEPNSGPETNLGADCANFVIFALRRDGTRIPWSDPKGLRANLARIASSIHQGQVHITPGNLERGLIVDLGTHVAAVMQDDPPFGILDENDLVAHQLKGVPQVIKLGELLRDRKANSFDLLEPRTTDSQTLLFGGDVMLGRSCATKIERGLNPFDGVKQLFSGCSFAAANLECAISDLKTPADRKKYSFRAPQRAAKSIAAAGFRVMGMANNHAHDFGHEVLRDCMLNLSREKVETVGVGATSEQAFMPKFFSLSGENRIALMAIDDLGSKGGPGGELATASDRVRLQAAIETARSRANFVVCLVHWGIENIPTVANEQRELGRWLVNHGVDAVIGSHPHCVQPLDFYHGSPIAYSLGNFVFDGAPNVASWNHGALLEIGLGPRGKVTAVRAIPIVLRDGLPEVSDGQGTFVRAQDPPSLEIAGGQRQ
jgi:poly-gamma-glutamate synthesis protein (capsule biosynthesis protein)